MRLGRTSSILDFSLHRLGHFSISKIILFLAVSILPKIIIAQITYNDIASINTLQSFQRVVIENNFELSTSTNDTITVYGHNLIKDSTGERANQWAYYKPESTGFIFVFVLNDLSRLIQSSELSSPYYKTIEEIKSSCSFYKIIDNYSCYSCPQSKYRGKIGFKLMDGNGMIRHFPNEP